MKSEKFQLTIMLLVQFPIVDIERSFCRKQISIFCRTSWSKKKNHDWRSVETREPFDSAKLILNRPLKYGVAQDNV